MKWETHTHWHSCWIVRKKESCKLISSRMMTFFPYLFWWSHTRMVYSLFSYIVTLNFLISLHSIHIKRIKSYLQSVKVQHNNSCANKEACLEMSETTHQVFLFCLKTFILLIFYDFHYWLDDVIVPSGEWSDVPRSTYVHTASDQCFWRQWILGYGHVLRGWWPGNWRVHTGEPLQRRGGGDGQGKCMQYTHTHTKYLRLTKCFISLSLVNSSDLDSVCVLICILNITIHPFIRQAIHPSSFTYFKHKQKTYISKAFKRFVWFCLEAIFSHQGRLSCYCFSNDLWCLLCRDSSTASDIVIFLRYCLNLSWIQPHLPKNICI